MSKKEEYMTPDVEFILVDALTCVKGVSEEEEKKDPIEPPEFED